MGDMVSTSAPRRGERREADGLRFDSKFLKELLNGVSGVCVSEVARWAKNESLRDALIEFRRSEIDNKARYAEMGQWLSPDETKWFDTIPIMVNEALTRPDDAGSGPESPDSDRTTYLAYLIRRIEDSTDMPVVAKAEKKFRYRVAWGLVLTMLSDLQNNAYGYFQSLTSRALPGIPVSKWTAPAADLSTRGTPTPENTVPQKPRQSRKLRTKTSRGRGHRAGKERRTIKDRKPESSANRLRGAARPASSLEHEDPEKAVGMGEQDRPREDPEEETAERLRAGLTATQTQLAETQAQLAEEKQRRVWAEEMIERITEENRKLRDAVVAAKAALGLSEM